MGLATQTLSAGTGQWWDALVVMLERNDGVVLGCEARSPPWAIIEACTTPRGRSMSRSLLQKCEHGFLWPSG